ncbi:hypothetical protein DN757_23580 [Paenibacillus silvae]|uniref:Uncharacterized protein n=1 Tax=Paenibacillus silvae TaxID=1325358 RepID=A0A2W6NB52_9BACL|nr:hypothetical protein DN757_23580 [Paenibacillus silvae]
MNLLFQDCNPPVVTKHIQQYMKRRLQSFSLRVKTLLFKMEQTLAEDFTVDMANHKYSFEESTSIIHTHCHFEENK